MDFCLVVRELQPLLPTVAETTPKIGSPDAETILLNDHQPTIKLPRLGNLRHLNLKSNKNPTTPQVLYRGEFQPSHPGAGHGARARRAEEKLADAAALCLSGLALTWQR